MENFTHLIVRSKDKHRMLMKLRYFVTGHCVLKPIQKGSKIVIVLAKHLNANY